MIKIGTPYLIGLLIFYLQACAIFFFSLKSHILKKKKENETGMKADKFERLSEGLSKNPFDPRNNDFNLQALTGSGAMVLMGFIFIIMLLCKC